MSPNTQPSVLTRWLASQPPPSAVAIDARRVTAVAISGHGANRAISSLASEPLAAGVVEPVLNAPNVHDQTALARAISAALDRLSPRPRRVALVLPDTVAKVSLLRFEKVPPRAQDLEQLIRWQIRKAAPFKIEEAQVSWVPGVALPDGGREFVVTVARRDVIESYERACEAAGAHAGIIDVATLNMVNAVIAAVAPSGDWMLVHVAPEYATLAVVRGQDLIFFRNRVTDAEEDLGALVHQTAMYHEDRLGGGGFSRVIVSGITARGPEQAERVGRSIQERLRVTPEPLDLRRAVMLRDRITVGPELVEAVAPALGVVLREEVA